MPAPTDETPAEPDAVPSEPVPSEPAASVQADAVSSNAVPPDAVPPGPLATPAKRVLVGAVAALFGAVALGLVLLESRGDGPAPPTSVVVPNEQRTAAVAVTPDGRAWRAVTDASCAVGSPAGGSGNGRSVVERRPAGTSTEQGWTPIEVPLAEVRRLSAAVDGSLVVAVGVDAGCRSRYTVSSDGGFTWQEPPTPAVTVSGEIVDASAGAAGALWVLVAPETGTPVVYIGTAGRLGLPRTAACQPGAGEPAFLSAVDSLNGTILCQTVNPLRQSQLRTGDGGRTWTVASGTGPSAVTSPAILKDGPVLAFGMPDGRSGYAMVEGLSTCKARELAATADGGTTWTRVGCFRSLASVDRALAVALDPIGHGLLVGTRGEGLVTLRTLDGGRTWS